MKADLDAADGPDFAVLLRFDWGVLDAAVEEWSALRRTKVRAASSTRMIAVRVRDQRTIDGAPWIDVEVSIGAVQTG
jgi:hypothetical protein